MEQTVGELIEMLSKFDRNTRIKEGNEIEFKYNGYACRLEVRKPDGDLDDTAITKLRSRIQDIRSDVDMMVADARSIVGDLESIGDELSLLP